jgi:hypothetical protein
MNIARALRKISNNAWTAKIEEQTGLQLRQPTPRGEKYISKVVQIFTEQLPEDPSDIYMHVRNRNDQRWGVDTDSLIPYKAADCAADLGLLGWPYVTNIVSTVTPGEILIGHLKRYTSELVTALGAKAIEIYENEDGDGPTWLAIINVPGYVPTQEPAEFDSPREAWEYLVEERRRQEQEDYADEKFSDVVEKLNLQAEAEVPTVGVVYGETPGYDGNHDQGLVYTVTVAEEEQE